MNPGNSSEKGKNCKKQKRKISSSRKPDPYEIIKTIENVKTLETDILSPQNFKRPEDNQKKPNKFLKIPQF